MDGKVVVCCEYLSKAGPYVDALKAAGVPGDEIQVVAPEAMPEDPRALGASAAGLVFCGGPDIHPRYYGEELMEDAGVVVMNELDTLEWELLSGAHEAFTPLWGICRGMQVINVFLGGTLWQDLKLQLPGVAEHHVDTPLDLLAHTVTVSDPGRRSGRLLSREGVRVNTRHHQAVRKLGQGLAPVAHSPDGVLEVMEVEGDWWVTAVQWHPENLVENPVQRALWREFVEAVRRHLSLEDRVRAWAEAAP